MERILIIEDDRASSKALKQLFEPDDCSIETAENGAPDSLLCHQAYQPKELQARVRAVLRRSGRPAPAVGRLCFGEVDVDFETMEALRKGRMV